MGNVDILFKTDSSRYLIQQDYTKLKDIKPLIACYLTPGTAVRCENDWIQFGQRGGPEVVKDDMGTVVSYHGGDTVRVTWPKATHTDHSGRTCPKRRWIEEITEETKIEQIAIGANENVLRNWVNTELKLSKSEDVSPVDVRN